MGRPAGILLRIDGLGNNVCMHVCMYVGMYVCTYVSFSLSLSLSLSLSPSIYIYTYYMYIYVIYRCIQHILDIHIVIYAAIRYHETATRSHLAAWAAGTMRGRVRVTEDPGGVKGLVRGQAGALVKSLPYRRACCFKGVSKSVQVLLNGVGAVEVPTIGAPHTY